MSLDKLKWIWNSSLRLAWFDHAILGLNKHVLWWVEWTLNENWTMITYLAWSEPKNIIDYPAWSEPKNLLV